MDWLSTRKGISHEPKSVYTIKEDKLEETGDQIAKFTGLWQKTVNDCDKSLICVKTETNKRFCYYIGDPWPTYGNANPQTELTGLPGSDAYKYLKELKNSVFFYFDGCGPMRVAV